MSEPPVDRDEFTRWRAEADAALRAARVQADAGLHNWACFAAEEAIKGLLHGLGVGRGGMTSSASASSSRPSMTCRAQSRMRCDG